MFLGQYHSGTITLVILDTRHIPFIREIQTASDRFLMSLMDGQISIANFPCMRIEVSH
jgi:hypothetical protein